MTATQRRDATRRIQLAFVIDGTLTGAAVKSAVETARGRVDSRYRDRIEYAPPIRVRPPLPAFAFVSGEPSCAAAVVQTLVQRGRGGTVVDLREKYPVIARDPELPRRSIRFKVTDAAAPIHAPRLPKSAFGGLLEGVLGLPQATGGAGVKTGDLARAVAAAKAEPGRSAKVAAETVAS